MSDLDELMSRDPLELSEIDLKQIIEYHRNLRARRAAGEKFTKPKPAGIDISSVTDKLLADRKPVVKIERKI